MDEARDIAGSLTKPGLLDGATQRNPSAALRAAYH